MNCLALFIKYSITNVLVHYVLFITVYTFMQLFLDFNNSFLEFHQTKSFIELDTESGYFKKEIALQSCFLANLQTVTQVHISTTYNHSQVLNKLRSK